ncbi:MAG: ATP-binding protein [Spirochaetaceae bacterium]|nr:ATP-binding protein [Treponema sp.]MBP3451049.1 ATP-binding protein [Spirochaetaceae bacterium]
MLAKFAVTNFRGFDKRIEINLTRTRNYDFNTFAIKNNIVKNGILYGQNGCGKSNFSLAMFDIVYHLTQKFKSPTYLANYAYASGQSKLLTFEYTFIFDNQTVDYIYSKDSRGTLQEEKLIVENKQIFNRRMGTFEIDLSVFPMEEHIKQNLSKNANNVSIINFLLTSYPLNENNYLIKLQNFVNSMLWFRSLEEKEFIGLETNIYILDEYIIRNNLLKEFSHFLEKVSNQHFDFVTPNLGDKVLRVYIKGVPQVFNLIASTGTHSLTLLFFWIKHMNKSSFVFIDEFDAFYHFKLSFDVCKELFKQDCQLFLSSHNTFLMTNDLLRPDCNFILNNNEIKALCDSTDKELREGHNIEKLYRGGAFEI